MVRNRQLLGIVAGACLLSPMVYGDAAIRSVRVASEAVVRVKPCEPVFVLLNVIAEAPADQGKMWEVPSELAERVVINGRDYGSLGRGANAAGFFLLNNGSVTTVGNSDREFYVVVMLCWSIEDKEYLFSEAGVYRVELYPGARVEVIVERPTADERSAVRELRDSGPEFAMFVMNSGNQSARELVPRAEEMLERYGNTVYAKHLSIALGTVKLRAVNPKFDAEGKCDPRTYVGERVAVARKYFEPYCRGDLESPFQAAAAYQLGEELAAQLRFMPEDAREERTRVRSEARVLLQKVKDSPYFLGNAKQAAATLDKLGD